MSRHRIPFEFNSLRRNSTMKVALVTGASSGIGKAIAMKLLDDGYCVAVTGRSHVTLTEAYESCNPAKVLMLQADSTDLGTYKVIITETIKRFGQLDVLVNNVGGGILGQTIGSVGIADWASMFRLNTESCFFTLQEAVPHLEKTRGVIINFSSILASRPVKGFLPYSASKAAVEMITQSAALELAPKGIRVLCISPATIETNFHQAAGMSAEAAAAYYAASTQTHPIGRIGVPADIAEMVAVLADGTKSGFMTGSVVHIDGGRMLTSAVASQMKLV